MTTASAAGLRGSRRREVQRRPARQPEQPEHQRRQTVSPVEAQATEPHGQRKGHDEVPADDDVQQPAPDPLGSEPASPQRVCSSPNDHDPQRNPGPLHDMYSQRRRLGDRTDNGHTFEKEEGSREKAKHYPLAHQDRGKEPDKPPHPSSFSRGATPQALKSISRTLAFTEASERSA